MAERLGESKKHGGNTDNSNSNTAGIFARSGKALVSLQERGKTRYGEKRQAPSGWR